MQRKNSRSAAGSGSIRKRPDGLWEARFTYLDELGMKKRKSVYGQTQKECRQKLTAATKAVDEGSYKEAKRMTVGEWLDEWLSTYCVGLKPNTLATYNSRIEKCIKPNIGAVKLSTLSNTMVQKFVNHLQGIGAADDVRKLAPKTVKSVHGILHKALSQAVIAGLINSNPADYVNLPKVKKPDLKPLMDEGITNFLNAAHGDAFERLYFVDLFTGIRQSELLGLQWRDVNWDDGTITVCRQWQKNRNGGGGYRMVDSAKNGKTREVSVPPSILSALHDQIRQQAEWQLAAGELWENHDGFIFTDQIGCPLKHETVYKHFKKICASIGMESTRFHDLRHSYAINAIQAGDNIKAVSDNLGHYSSAFTMDVYGETSETMRKKSQNIMEELIKQVSNL